MNEGYKALNSVLSNSELRTNAKKVSNCTNALYGAKAWGMRSAERTKVNVLETKCLVSWVGVSRMNRGRNDEERIRAKGSWRVEWIIEY